MNEEVIEKRKGELQEFLGQLLNIEEIQKSPTVADYFINRTHLPGEQQFVDALISHL